MKKQGFSKARNALKGKGFLFALILSVAAVGTATYIAYNNAMTGLDQQPEMTAQTQPVQPPSTISPVNAEQTGIPKDDTTKTEDVPAVATTNQDEPANNFFTATPPRVMPVDGEIINGYSNGELVKSETLGVWQTHDGIDIAAENGTPVRSSSVGTVSSVYEDPLWGNCVVINHGDGVVGYYFGLDKAISVVEGQEVESGQEIGKAGSTADCEIKLAPHIHFAVKKNGEFTDPLEYISG